MIKRQLNLFRSVMVRADANDEKHEASIGNSGSVRHISLVSKEYNGGWQAFCLQRMRCRTSYWKMFREESQLFHMSIKHRRVISGDGDTTRGESGLGSGAPQLWLCLRSLRR